MVFAAVLGVYMDGCFTLESVIEALVLYPLSSVGRRMGSSWVLLFLRVVVVGFPAVS